MVSTPRSSTESSSAPGAPRGRRNTQRLDDALGGGHTLVPPDVVTLPDRERVFATPRSGDWILLAIMLATLLGCGGYVWYRLGLHDHIGRAVFFGLALVCLYWTALIYTFKLSLSVHVGPQGISVVRGPWRMELRWGDVSRLMERAQLLDGRRYRWVVAQGRDERRIQVREDMVTDYARFRLEVYERYRLWRDHGGTWGTTSGGPFTARESVGDEIRWWLIGASVTALPGAYFTLLLPETNPLGLALLAIAALCVVMALRALLLRQVYTVDSRIIIASYLIGKAQLGWREISRVERSRNPVSGLIRGVAVVCRLGIAVAARSEVGLRCFPWSPRVPEYLTLRGAGRHVRVRLHRLSRPDELLAWIEFYERVGRRPAGSQTRPRQAAPTVQLPPEKRVATATIPLTDLSDEGGPRDPWAAATADPIDLPTVPTPIIATSANGANDGYEDDEYEDDDEANDPENAPPVVAMTAEELEDAWLISTNKRPTVLAPDARPSVADEARMDEPAPTQAPYPPSPQPFQSAQPGWGDAFAATASEDNGYQGYDAYPDSDDERAATAGGAGGAAGRSGPVDGTIERAGRPPYPGYQGYPAYPGYPDEAAPPAATEPSGPPVWTFPESVTEPEPASSSSSFSPFSRDELLAELSNLGPVAPPTPSGVVPTPPAPRPTQRPAQQAPSDGQRRRPEPPAPEIADAPTSALEAVPPGGAYQQEAGDATSEAEGEYADESAELPEPERPWLQEGWQPPALPRFGPGTRSPFHNPDDTD